MLSRYYTTLSKPVGLKIAYFGSDEFSITVLKKLLEFKKQNTGAITQLDLIARKQKLAGRGLQTFKDVPIVSIGMENNCNIIRAEAKQEIIELSANKYDLAVAVSYGKLIPADFIKSLRYCGLNVHPSLLPKHSGASPLQTCLLKFDKFTGVTVQTLHPTKFDQGDIINQSKEVEVSEDESFESLRDKLANIGGDLLVDSIDKQLFVDIKPLKNNYEFSYAGKLSPDMKKIDWESNTSRYLKRKVNTLGSLFSFKKTSLKKRRQKHPVVSYKRVIFYDVEIEETSGIFDETQLNGSFVLSDDETKILIKTADGVISTKRLKFECFGEEDALTFYKNLQKRSGQEPHIFTEKPAS